MGDDNVAVLAHRVQRLEDDMGELRAAVESGTVAEAGFRTQVSTDLATIKATLAGNKDGLSRAWAIIGPLAVGIALWAINHWGT